MNEQQATAIAEHIEYMDDAQWRDDMSIECEECGATCTSGEHANGVCMMCYHDG